MKDAVNEREYLKQIIDGLNEQLKESKLARVPSTYETDKVIKIEADLIKASGRTLRQLDEKEEQNIENNLRDFEKRLIRFDRVVLENKDELFAVLENLRKSEYEFFNASRARIAEFFTLLGSSAKARKKAWSEHSEALSKIGIKRQPEVRGNQLYEAYFAAIGSTWNFLQTDELTLRELAFGAREEAPRPEEAPREEAPTTDWANRFHGAISNALDDERSGLGDQSGPACLAKATIATLFGVHQMTIKSWLKDRNIHFSYNSRNKTGRISQ